VLQGAKLLFERTKLAIGTLEVPRTADCLQTARRADGAIGAKQPEGTLQRVSSRSNPLGIVSLKRSAKGGKPFRRISKKVSDQRSQQFSISARSAFEVCR